MDEIWGYISAVFLAFFGRALALATSRPGLTWALFWELPAVVALGIIGSGVAEYMGLKGHTAGAVIAVIAYIGPRGISEVFQVVLRKVGNG